MWQVDQLESLVRSAWRDWALFAEGHEELLAPLDCKPVAIGIKVADERSLLAQHAALFRLGDQSHIGPVNSDRSIAVIRQYLPLHGGLRYVKILQRRPGRSDRLGVEHLDLQVPAGANLHYLSGLLKERMVECEIESNDAHAWLSIRHKGFEFKLVDHDLWAVLIGEMQAVLEPRA